MTTKYYKTIFIFLSILPLFLFVLPLWKITMDAPQFPEGLAMFIHINKVEGIGENGLNSINNLNHYIGMKKIEPEGIPELKIMPPLVVFISILGLIFAFIGNKKLLLIWIIIFTILALAGIYDFYLWQTDYGQNLDPNAILKMEGMSYQPPLFGTKEIMNFTVTSLPDTGGWLLFGSLLCSWVVFLFVKIKKQ